MALSLRSLVLVCLHNFLLIHVCEGKIECVCTTADCQQEHRTVCEANHMCYVQYMSPSEHTEHVHVVRGCIDDHTPLLCENRRPQAYTGSWPVLHCCREDFCNKDVLPTDPTWLSAANDRPLKEVKSTQNKITDSESDHKLDTDSSDDPLFAIRDGQVKPQEVHEKTHIQQRHRDRPKTLNPLYIGVPVAGACVLLAIIIFAIYVLRRQNQYMEDYRYHMSHSSNLRPHHPCPHKAMVRDLDGHHIHHQPHPTKSSYYSECERSSSGSETKLLMKV